MAVCPNCGKTTAENAIFCDQCGHKLPAAEPEIEQGTVVETPAGGVPAGVVICPDCGAENVPGEVFCDVCGNPLEAPEPVAEAVISEPAPEAAIVEVEEVEIVEAEPVIEQVEAEVVEAEPVIETVVVEAEVEAVEAQPVVGEAAYCPTCGAQLQPGDVFCGNCGAAVAEVPIAEQVLPEEPIVGEIVEEPVEEVLIEEVVVEEVPGEQVAVETVIVEEAVIEEEDRCPVCGAGIVPGQTFCASCGAALQPVQEAVAQPTPVAPPSAAPPGPYLEVVVSGAHIPLVDQAELLIGREDEVSGIHPDVDMTPHGGMDGGVSRRHARLIHEGNAWYVLDLDSTNGTYVNGVELQPKVRMPLSDGDTLGLGDVETVFHAG